MVRARMRTDWWQPDVITEEKTCCFISLCLHNLPWIWFFSKFAPHSLSNFKAVIASKMQDCCSELTGRGWTHLDSKAYNVDYQLLLTGKMIFPGWLCLRLCEENNKVVVVQHITLTTQSMPFFSLYFPCIWHNTALCLKANVANAFGIYHPSYMWLHLSSSTFFFFLQHIFSGTKDCLKHCQLNNGGNLLNISRKRTHVSD